MRVFLPVQCIQADIDTVNACLPQRYCQSGQQRAVGRETNFFNPLHRRSPGTDGENVFLISGSPPVMRSLRNPNAAAASTARIISSSVSISARFFLQIPPLACSTDNGDCTVLLPTGADNRFLFQMYPSFLIPSKSAAEQITGSACPIQAPLPGFVRGPFHRLFLNRSRCYGCLTCYIICFFNITIAKTA